ncbi:MAG: family 43 glycosylhydrolase [Clostridia bacterium]|nr:family 43 glycosylhydrolase [Clostridia bacterium]
MKLENIHLRDPFVYAENGRYYLYGTRRGETTKRIPWQGLDVYISEDLVEWSEPIECFTRPSDFWADRDFFAPEVYKYNGKYYMFASFRSEDRLRCSQILKSDSPTGPFLPFTDGPITPEGWTCLDATFYVDDDGTPWTAFCHEWTQIGNGTVEAMPLTPDLSAPAGEPVTIIRAGDVPWAYSLINVNGCNFVTDGPFFRRGKNGKLYLLWSSFHSGPQYWYVQALAISDSGSILGPWRHADKFIYDEDGGHGMIFDGFDKNTYLILHSTNVNPNERPRLFKITETGDGFEIAERMG